MTHHTERHDGSSQNQHVASVPGTTNPVPASGVFVSLVRTTWRTPQVLISPAGLATASHPSWSGVIIEAQHPQQI